MRQRPIRMQDRCHVTALICIHIVIVLPVLLGAQPPITNPRIIEHPEDQYVSKNDPATLNCKAEGEPPPLITWYRDGTAVTTADENPSSHRMQLPSGQLFFLRIIHNKSSKPDVGVYYCIATNPETGVSVQSRNATLDIAQLREDFRVLPRDTTASVGETARLECRPPRGQPEPRVRWKKNGEVIGPDNTRAAVDDTGNLIISAVRRSDSGRYACVAKNKADERETPAVNLEVLQRPIFTEAPQDQLVNANDDVTFSCAATGDPPPRISWSREGGDIPNSRSRILDDNSLTLTRIRDSDEGNYVCRAENTMGHIESTVRLTVHTQPSFITTPQNKVVGVGRRVSLRCEVTGIPRPAVFWNKATSQVLMFPRQNHGRYSVSESGTLTINPVRNEDAGEYECQALSVAGSALAKATLEVRDVDPRPPPIIHQGPQNQTLPVNSVAMLQCHPSGRPAPTIRWYKDSYPLSPGSDTRITQLSSGTLQISDLRTVDSGVYTCKAMSETGETRWSAGLTVEDPSNKNVIFHRTPEPTTFPGRPSKPTMTAKSPTSISLAWKANANHGASPVYAYSVEYFSHETGEGWIQATSEVSKQSYTVRGLSPDTGYLFLVRAKNNHGVSEPSEVSHIYRTQGSRSGDLPRPTLGMLDMELVSQRLSGQTVLMAQPEVISSSKIKISWEVLRSHQFIEGFHVKYREMPDLRQHLQSQRQHQNLNEDGSHYHHHVDYTIKTVSSPQDGIYLLDGLKPYTWYEIRIQPFYLTIEGQESNVVRARTAEAVPSAPPRDIVLHMLANNTLRLSWAPPAPDHHNGPLTGYKIFLHGNESKFSREILTNASVHSVVISHLVPTISYGVQIAALNKIGTGARSARQSTGGDGSGGLMTGIVGKPWFIATLIGTIGGTLWFALCVFSVWLYRKRKKQKKIHKGNGGALSVPVHHANDPSRDHSTNPLISANGSVTVDGMQPDITHIHTAGGGGGSVGGGSIPHHGHNGGANIMHHDGTYDEKEPLYNTPNINPPLKTFYSRNNTPTAPSASPYATTTLVGGGKESAFRPIQAPPGYTTHPSMTAGGGGGSSGADSSCVMKNDMGSASDHSERMHNDDPNRSGMLGGAQQPMLFLPPPPEHPPPSDIGTPPDSPTPDHRHGAMLPHNAGQNGGRSSLRGAPPYSHLRNPAVPSYSDGEYQQQQQQPPQQQYPHQQQQYQQQQQQQQQPSSKCRTMSPRSHVIDAVRGYSPVRAMSEPERGPTPPIRGYKHISGDEASSGGGSGGGHHAVGSPHGAVHPPHGLPLHMSDNEASSGIMPSHHMGYGVHTPPSPAPAPLHHHAPHHHPQLHHHHAPPPSQHGVMGMMGEDGSVVPVMDNGQSAVPTSLAIQEAQQPHHPHHLQHMDGGGYYPHHHHHHHQGVDPELNAERYMNGAESPELIGDSDMEHMGGEHDPALDGVENQNGEWDVGSNSDASSCSNSLSSDGSFLAEADFASAVARAAELSGLTVTGTTVTDPNHAQREQQREQRRVRRSHRQRERAAARPSSPYSTDSNYSSVAPPQPRYVPRSERKKHIKDHNNHHRNANSHHQGGSSRGQPHWSSSRGGSGVSSNEQQSQRRPSGTAAGGGGPPPVKTKPNHLTQSPQGQGEVTPFSRPVFPSTNNAINGNNSSGGGAMPSPRLGGTPKMATKSPPYTPQNGFPSTGGTTSTAGGSIRTNPLALAFDETTPIV